MQTFDALQFFTRYGLKYEPFMRAVSLIRYGLDPDYFDKRIACWIAGGSVRRVINGDDPLESDFDFFFNTEVNYNRIKDRLLKYPGCGAHTVNEFNTTLTVTDTLNDNKKVKLQLINVAYYSSIQEVLESFDFTICQFGLDIIPSADGLNGAQLWCGDTSLFDLARKRLVVNKITFPIASVRRMIKYTKQGFYACEGCIRDILLSVSQNPQLLNNLTKYID